MLAALSGQCTVDTPKPVGLAASHVFRHCLSAAPPHKADSPSINALSTVYEILGHCRKQFGEILAVVNKLKREREGGRQAGDGAEGAEKVQIEVDVLARVKWAFKRGEVRRMQRDLDSMKLTLGIMLQALEFSKISVEKRYLLLRFVFTSELD